MSKRKEVYLKYINNICSKVDLDKKVLTFFIENNGNIEDIIEGIEVLTDELDEVCDLVLLNILKLRKDVVSDNVLYNIANYCVLNNVESVGRKKNYYKLKNYCIRKACIRNTFVENIKNNGNSKYGSFLVIESFAEDVIPDNCNYQLLENSDKKKLFGSFVKELVDIEYSDGSYDCLIVINIVFTDCIVLNMALIKSWIDKEFSNYVSKVEELKEFNKKYFNKQIIQRNINQF